MIDNNTSKNIFLRHLLIETWEKKKKKKKMAKVRNTLVAFQWQLRRCASIL
jgi:hypothetical protein